MASSPRNVPLLTAVLLVVAAFLLGVLVHKRQFQRDRQGFPDEERGVFSRPLRSRWALGDAEFRVEESTDDLLGAGLGMISKNAKKVVKMFFQTTHSFSTVVGEKAIEVQQDYSNFFSNFIVGTSPRLWRNPRFVQIWPDYGHGDRVYKSTVALMWPKETELLAKLGNTQGQLKPASDVMKGYMAVFEELNEKFQAAVQRGDQQGAKLYAAMAITAMAMCQGTNWAMIGNAILQDTSVKDNKALQNMGNYMAKSTGSKIRLMRNLITTYGFNLEFARLALVNEAKLMGCSVHRIQELEDQLQEREDYWKERLSQEITDAKRL